MASSASQRRAALATTTSSTGWTSVGEPLMTRKHLRGRGLLL